MTSRKGIFVNYVIASILCLGIISLLGINGDGCNTAPLLKKEFRFVVGTPGNFDYGTILIEYKPDSVIRDNKKFGSYYYIVNYAPSDETATHEMEAYKVSQIAKINEKTERDKVQSDVTDAKLDLFASNAIAEGWNMFEPAIVSLFADYDTYERYQTRHLITAQLSKETDDEVKRDAALKEQWKLYLYEEWLKRGVINIAFYDKSGNSLLKAYGNKTFRPHSYAGHTYESNLRDGVNISEISQINKQKHGIKTIDETLEWKGQFDENWLTFENFQDIDWVKAEYIR